MPAARRSRLLGAVIALVTAACGTSGSGGDSPGAALSPSSAPTPTSTVTSTVGPTTTTRPCQRAPLETRAATVLTVGIGQATTSEAPLPVSVTDAGVGGVILLGPNVVNAAQVRELIAGLRRRSPHGLLVSVDEEGGRVSRLRPIIGSTPSARTLGRQSLADISDRAAERGTVLKDLGFDLVLAPVADADSGPSGGPIGDRAFAGTPTEAGARAAAFSEGLRRSGISAAAKHFPGQGGLADSHDGSVVSSASVAEVQAAADEAFRPLVSGGTPAVMMSHVTFSALGSRPASLEPAAYRMLRSMGFNGVAITDAIGMEAIVEHWTLGEAAVLALEAGADLVLATPGDKVTAMRDAVVAAVSSGRLPESRLDEAVGRVLTLRGQDRAAMVCR